MRRNLYIFICLTCLFAVDGLLHAQARATREKDRALQVGGGFTVASPDYTDRNIIGITVYGDYDFTRHFGVEGDLHFLTLSEPRLIGERTYLVGPRASIRSRRYDLYAKVLGGVGTFVDNNSASDTFNTNFNYGLYAVGGGVDLHITDHVNVRPVDIEYQSWFNYAKIGPQTGLTPLLYTFGVAYNFK